MEWRLWAIILYLVVSAAGQIFNYEVGERVKGEINNFAVSMTTCLEVPYSMIRTNVVNITNPIESARDTLFLPMNAYKGLTNLYVGLETGMFFGYGTATQVPFNFIIKRSEMNGNTMEQLNYNINRNGYPTSFYSRRAYLVTKRPWYIRGKSFKVRFWPAPYIDAATGNPIISLVYPLVNITNRGTFYPYLGALAVDIDLDSLSKYLKNAYQDRDKHVYIMDSATGFLLGASVDARTSTTTSTGGKAFLKAVDSENPDVSETAKSLIAANWPDSLIIVGEHYVQSILCTHEYPGLSWRVVILLPAFPPLNYIKEGTTEYSMILFAVALSMLFSVMGLWFMVSYRNSKLIRMTNPAFTVTLLVGGIMSGVAVYFNLGANTHRSCIIRPYLFNMAFVLVFSPVLLKSFFLYQTFVIRGERGAFILINIRTLLLSVVTMCGLVCLLIAPAIKFGGSGYDPVTYLHSDSTGLGQVTVCGYDKNFMYYSALTTYRFAMLGSACFFSFFSYSTTGHLPGTRTLLIITFNTAFINAIVGVSTVLIPDPVSLLLIQGLGVCFCVMVGALVLIFPIYYRIVTDGDDAAAEAITALAVASWKSNKYKTKAELKREATMFDWLADAPIHKAVSNRVPLRLLKKVFKHHADTASCIDFNGNSVYETAVKVLTRVDEDDEEIAYMEYIVKQYLPFDTVTLDERSSERHGFVWTWLVQSAKNIQVVQRILDAYPEKAILLSQCVDPKGRSAVSIASPACGHIIKLATYFFKRYEILSKDHPQYMSKSCIVHLAIDHQEGGRHVAMKFMNDSHSFVWEVNARSAGVMDEMHVVNVIVSHDGDSDADFATEIQRRGFGKFRYCVVMLAAEKDMQAIIANERVAGREWDTIRKMFMEVVLALAHVHARGIIHGDVKPANIMRSENRLKLIDFGNSARIGQDNCNIRSSAYSPPEAIHMDVAGRMSKKATHEGEKDGCGKPLPVLNADSSFDLWSAGLVLFELCTGSKLFPPDVEDNTDEENLQKLMTFTDDFKARKLARITHVTAHNLVSQLLTKDPARRPGIPQILCHPFMVNRIATRMIGDPAQFDFFISYRVSSDSPHAALLFQRLGAAGFKPWWDKVMLKPGVPWEEGFCDGLVLSRIFVPIISRGAINNPGDLRCCWPKLHADSPADNVLLEHRLALELLDRGLIEKVIPIYVGDKTGGGGGAAGGGNDGSDGVYSDYFQSSCMPDLSRAAAGGGAVDPVVLSVEDQLRGHLERLCLGPPVRETAGVAQVFQRITQFAGPRARGPAQAAFDQVINALVESSSKPNSDSLE